MITKLISGGVLLVFLSVGCADQEAEARRSKQEAEAKARAEAARKEMVTLPKAFKSRDYFKKNEPDQKSDPAPEKSTTNP